MTSQNHDTSWTIETYAVHNEALRLAEARFQDERDRRYTEVNIEKEKALKIKETADLAALQLARDIQIYKDEKANELREQINSERGLYVTKSDLGAVVSRLEAIVQPLTTYVTSQQGGAANRQANQLQTNWQIGLMITIAIAGTGIAIRLLGG